MDIFRRKKEVNKSCENGFSVADATAAFGQQIGVVKRCLM
jgi:hypothetical protein